MSGGTPELTPAGKQPLLTNIFQCSTEFLEQLRFYFEQNPPTIPISNIPGFTQFTVQGAPFVNATETTTSTTYVDLTTTGPILTGLPDGQYAIIFGCFSKNNTAAALSVLSPSINGAAPNDNDQGGTSGVEGMYTTRMITKSFSTGGGNSIKLQYKVSAGTGTFLARWLFALRYANL